MYFKSILFNTICFIHLLGWLFITLAFLNVKYAKINLYYVIPIIYLLHMLPFHVLIKAKQSLFPLSFQAKIDEFEGHLIFPILYRKITHILNKHCTFNPTSPQGMLLFGAITSAYAIKYNKNLI